MEDEIYEIYEKFVNHDLRDWSDWSEYTGYALDTKHLFLEEVLELPSIINKNKTTELYKITTKSGREYKAAFVYYTFDYAIEEFDKKIASADFKKSPINSKLYSKLKNNIGTDGMLCMVRFEDGSGNTKITNQEGNRAYEVFSGVQIAGTQSINKYLDKLQVICIRVSKDESKRIDLYKLIMNKKLKEFKHLYIDTVTERDDKIDVLVFTKSPINLN